MSNKKYLSIADVSNLTGISAHKLRYIEKTDKSFKVLKVRDRRYYTISNVEYLNSKYSNRSSKQEKKHTDQEGKVVYKIDDLLDKFNDLIKT